MATTDNGWKASKDLKTVVIEPVKGFRVRVVDNPNVVAVFTYLVQQYHARVDDVTEPHPMDDWGFYYKPNANSPWKLSRHSGGIAIDVDATEHPNNVSVAKTFTSAQVSEIHKILDELDDVVRWGGDYTHTIDGMHFEINVRPGDLHEIGGKIRRGEIGPKKPAKGNKTVAQVAKEVVAGKWGNAPQRKARLIKAGYDYNKIQAAVKAQMPKKPPTKRPAKPAPNQKKA